MLSWHQDQERIEDRELARIDQVKLALIAGKFSTMEQLFPEYVPGDQGGEFFSDIDPREAKQLSDLLERGGVLTFEDLFERR